MQKQKSKNGKQMKGQNPIRLRNNDSGGQFTAIQHNTIATEQSKGAAIQEFMNQGNKFDEISMIMANQSAQQKQQTATLKQQLR